MRYLPWFLILIFSNQLLANTCEDKKETAETLCDYFINHQCKTIENCLYRRYNCTDLKEPQSEQECLGLNPCMAEIDQLRGRFSTEKCVYRWIVRICQCYKAYSLNK